eukprot:gnl/TRDRNA2_/TRDRNA2_150407_c0_seq1.p1 gnl/TRDRNA2_/TRDRNA2_150407_c0~~gnl/TRDRNA2_/TRDRNA2_150407_c0_seq1.p1  ORF type:complete len:602 (+),score=68.02 gnl/TRDRNA2_/TRDRNA2_150407_c0_seq1:89-1894(+)
MCDEGKKSFLYSVNCKGDIRRCEYCGQYVCEAHEASNDSFSLVKGGGHSGCAGPQCQIGAMYKHACVAGTVSRCKGCNKHFCSRHLDMAGPFVVAGGHHCEALPVCGDCTGPQCQIGFMHKQMCSAGSISQCAGCGEYFCETHINMAGFSDLTQGHTCKAFSICDEGKKSSASAAMCTGNLQTCDHCGQKVCTFHFETNCGGMRGGHSNCPGPQCQVSFMYRHRCCGVPTKCVGCSQYFCSNHLDMAGLTDVRGGHTCQAFAVCDEGKKSTVGALSCSGNLQECEYCGQRVCAFHRLTNREGMRGGHGDCSGPQCDVEFSQDSSFVQMAERFPLIGYGVSAAHSAAGHDDRASRAAARCTNATITTGIAAASTVACVLATPAAAGAGVVLGHAAAGSFVGGATGAAAGNISQYQMEESMQESGTDMPGGMEVHKKNNKELALDSAVASVCPSEILISTAQQVSAYFVGELVMDLDTSDLEVSEAWANVCSEAAPLTWLLLWYQDEESKEGEILKLFAKGTGGREELLAHVDDSPYSEVFGGFRTISGRLLLLTCVGASVDSVSFRAKAHRSVAFGVLTGGSGSICAVGRDELAKGLVRVDF